MNGASRITAEMVKQAYAVFPMDAQERALGMSPNVNVGPTVSLGMPGMGNSQSASFFDEHAAFQDYINQMRVKAMMQAAAEAKGGAESGTRRNLLGLATLGGLGGGLAGYHAGGMPAAMTAGLAGAGGGGLMGVMAPSEIGNMTLGAGLGAIPGAYLGHELGKKYKKHAIPALVAGILGGGSLGALMGR